MKMEVRFRNLWCEGVGFYLVGGFLTLERDKRMKDGGIGEDFEYVVLLELSRVVALSWISD